MQIHQLRPSQKSKPRQRVGRGGKKGTYSGRGMKGQKSRAGRKPRPGFAGGDTTLVKRLPKKRGTVGKVPIRKGIRPSRNRTKPVILTLGDLEESFKAGEIVSPKTLLKKGLVGRIKGRVPKIKVLKKGEIKKKLIFKGIKFSKSAYEVVK